MCLETLLMQPGLNIENVVVCIDVLFSFISKRMSWYCFQVAVDEKFSESLTLIDLFGFRGEKTASSSTYMGKRECQ
jgi:hypothetical protein